VANITKMKIKEGTKKSDKNIFKGNIPQEIINCIFSIPDKTLLIVCILQRRLT
jgi:hypothetical protein